MTIQTKPKALWDPQADADLRNSAMKETRTQLLVRGVSDEEATRLITKFKGNFTTVPKVGGHELRIRLMDGSVENTYAIPRFVRELEQESVLDSYGARPEER